MTKDALAQPEQKQTGIREIRVTETVKQEQKEDWDAMGQKILVATARDTKRTWEDAAVKAVHKLMQEEQEPVGFYVYKPTLPRGHLGNVSDGDLPWVYAQDPSSGYSARMLVYTTPQKREWVDLTDEQLMECTVHNRFEYEPPCINNVGETRVARHEVALRATYENINRKLKELNT